MKLTLLQELQAAIDHAPEQPLTLGSLVRATERRGFGLILMTLSLPSALPIPAPGYSTPFGIIMIIFAWQMMRGRATPLLPAKWTGKELSRETTHKVLRKAAPFVSFIEKFLRPRLRWLHTPVALRAIGVIVALMSCLMIIPIPGTNTLPALVIFCLSVSLCEEDGAMAMFASVLSFLAIALYTAVVYILVTKGYDAVEAFFDSIKDLLR